MSQCVRALIAEAIGVLSPANAEGVEDEQERTGHDEEGVFRRGSAQDRRSSPVWIAAACTGKRRNPVVGWPERT
jgi:hypothetical protein